MPLPEASHFCVPQEVAGRMKPLGRGLISGGEDSTPSGWCYWKSNPDQADRNDLPSKTWGITARGFLILYVWYDD